MKKYALCLLMALVYVVACSNNNEPEEEIPDIPIGPIGPGVKGEKPIQMWVDAHANFTRLETKEAITSTLERLKATGFTEVYIDVKPNIGYALYNSKILPQLTKWGPLSISRDWDYLQFWIDEAEKFDIKVIASISTFGFGSTRYKEGVVYDDKRWDGKTQVAMVGNNPNNLEDIRNRDGVDAAFLNPAIPEVRAFVLEIIKEIVTNYPKLKGFCLDYCRWYNNGSNPNEGNASRYYGFEDATISAFEQWHGEKMTSRNDIVTSTGGRGPLFAQWTEFRTMTITNFVTEIRKEIKSINPDIELHFWASAHWASRYGVSQNWASKKYIPSGGQYTPTYNKWGFADQLDVFSLGAYADAAYRKDAPPGSDWSVENFVTTYKQYIQGDCKVYGSFASYADGGNLKTCTEMVYLCLKHTDGLMVFELSHVINKGQWDAIKQGIEMAGL